MIYTVENTVLDNKPVKVFVDGIEIKYAFYADTDMGFVKFYTMPKDTEFNGAEAEVSEIYGAVKVLAD